MFSRKSLEVSAQSDEKLVSTNTITFANPLKLLFLIYDKGGFHHLLTVSMFICQVPLTESPVGPHKEIVNGGQNLSNNFEVPILIEDDGNVEKAEACAKELDDVSYLDFILTSYWPKIGTSCNFEHTSIFRLDS